MRQSRLTVGEMAPAITAHALDGTALGIPASANGASQWTLVSFLRYASCPMCNLRMREIARALPTLRAHGIVVVMVVHSPPATALRFVPPALVARTVADPSGELYRDYAVERSWWSMARTMLVPSFHAAVLKATVLGYWGGRIDGPLASMPGDFLIAPDGVLRACRYGAHLADHLSVDDALAATGRQPLGPPVAAVG